MKYLLQHKPVENEQQGGLLRLFLTWLVLALDVIAGDGAVAVEAHGPPEGDAPSSHLPDLYLRGVGGLWANTHTQLCSEQTPSSLQGHTNQRGTASAFLAFLWALMGTLILLITCWKYQHFSTQSHWCNLEYWLPFDLLGCISLKSFQLGLSFQERCFTSNKRRPDTSVNDFTQKVITGMWVLNSKVLNLLGGGRGGEERVKFLSLWACLKVLL